MNDDNKRQFMPTFNTVLIKDWISRILIDR